MKSTTLLWCVFSHFSFAKEGVNKAPRNKLDEVLHELKSLNIKLTNAYGSSFVQWYKYFCFYFYMDWMPEFKYLA